MEHRNKRILMSVLGVVICAISVGFFKRAAFGVDPFQSFMAGLDAMIPISFGTLYVIVSICMLLFSLLADRSKIGIATVINLFLVGYIVDFSHKLLLSLTPDLGIAGRCVMLIIGIVVMCLTSSFYFTADLGVSVYDAIALVISEKWHLLPFRVCRVICDFICVLIGVILFLASGHPLSQIGQVAGIGTIITAFFMGPLIDFFNRKVAQPFLNGKQ